MTFKELLDKYQFEEIVPEIRTVWAHNDISGFKMAFDCLKALTPKPSEDIVDITIAGDESDPYIRVMGLSEDHWENGLSKPIYINRLADINLSEKMLLAHCLWEITYYGFTQRAVKEKFHGFRNRWEENNKFDKMLRELIIRHYRKEVKPKNRSYLKNGEPAFRAKNKTELNKYLFSPRKTNRRKRKAEKRYRERKEYLERMSRRTETIKRLSRDGSSFSCKDLEFILTINMGQEETYESFPTASSNRATYLEDLIINYDDLSNLAVKKISDIVIFAESSKDTPVSSEEEEILRNIFSQLYPSARIHYGFAVNEEAGSEILLSINIIDR